MKKKAITITIGLFSIAVFFISGCAKAPTPCFSVDKGNVAKINEEVQFDGACSTNAKSYSWDFGDGTSTTGNPVKHKYTSAGTYAVKLTAINRKKSETLVQNVIINP